MPIPPSFFISFAMRNRQNLVAGRDKEMVGVELFSVPAFNLLKAYLIPRITGNSWPVRKMKYFF